MCLDLSRRYNVGSRIEAGFYWIILLKRIQQLNKIQNIKQFERGSGGTKFKDIVNNCVKKETNLRIFRCNF